MSNAAEVCEMREMKDSGIEWIGEIPANWSLSRLKQLFSIVSGGTPNGATIEYWDGDIPWITPADYKTKDIYVFKGHRSLTKIGYQSSSATLIPKDSIVFSKRAPIGSVALTKQTLCTNQGCLGLVNESSAVDNKYYYYFLSIFPEIFELFGSGTTFKEISASVFGNMTIPYPAIEKQTAISDFLDSKCAQIDALSEKIQSQIQLLEDYKKSVITEAVTKGLDRNVPMKDSGIEWAKEIPHHWQTMPNKYIMEKIKVICAKRENEDIISLSINGVIVRDLDAGGKMPSSFDGYQYVYPGNLLMCLFDYDVTPRCIGLINNFGLTSPAYSQFVLKNHNCSKYYYYYYLMLDYTKELLHLAKNLRHSFTEEQLGMIKTPVPPISEQKQIADYLDDRTAQIDGQVEKCRAQLEALAAYKKSLIYEYVTGKKEVFSMIN